MTFRLSYVFDSLEPVSVAEAKLAARVDGSELDALITGLIEAGRLQAELLTGRCYRAQVQRTELATWPSASDVVPVFNASACAITYWSGTQWASLAGTAYVFAPGGVVGQGTVLAPVTSTSWPILVDRPVGPRVRIDLTAGQMTGADVPQTVKTYIKATVASWLDSGVALVSKDLVPNPMLERLLDGERLWF